MLATDITRCQPFKNCAVQQELRSSARVLKNSEVEPSPPSDQCVTALCTDFYKLNSAITPPDTHLPHPLFFDRVLYSLYECRGYKVHFVHYWITKIISEPYNLHFFLQIQILNGPAAQDCRSQLRVLCGRRNTLLVGLMSKFHR